jgi:uncharacterized protein YbbK (DUF523 family)
MPVPWSRSVLLWAIRARSESRGVSSPRMEKILVSACLLGERVRYNGADKRCDHEVLQRWIDEGRIVPVCPEVGGGLPVPRLPAEIEDGAGGASVLAGAARVVDREGRDVSRHFLSGAQLALASARANGIRIAILKEGSPSCGSSVTHDGTFGAGMVEKPGVTTALLEQAGIHVFSESELLQADALLQEMEASGHRGRS